MKLLGLVSDTHDALAYVAPAVAFFQERDVDAVLHLGDITRPETVDLFAGLPTTFLRGNNDVDGSLDEGLARHGFAPLALTWTSMVEGVRVGATHGHARTHMERLRRDVDVLLHGHSHRRRAVTEEGTLVVNPGALHRVTVKTVALLELPARRTTFYEVRPDGVLALP